MVGTYWLGVKTPNWTRYEGRVVRIPNFEITNESKNEQFIENRDIKLFISNMVQIEKSFHNDIRYIDFRFFMISIFRFLNIDIARNRTDLYRGCWTQILNRFLSACLHSRSSPRYRQWQSDKKILKEGSKYYAAKWKLNLASIRNPFPLWWGNGWIMTFKQFLKT